MEVTVLLQNGWTPRNSIGTRFEELREILDKLPAKVYGVCLDTRHAFISGYDLRTSESCYKFIEDYNKIVSVDTLKFIHLDDSKMGIASHIDNHEHLGLGKIGIEDFKNNN